jgi:predicted O-methyltransferase YrrM
MEEPLTVHTLPQSSVLPLEKILNSKGFRAGVRDANDEPVTDSLLFRTRRNIEKQFVYPGRTGAEPQRISGSSIYMGPLFGHFGHFLLEGLSRAWHAPSLPDVPIAWSIDASRQEPAYLDWQREILAVLGVNNAPLFISEPTVFDEVLVPEPGYRIQYSFHPQHRDFLAVVPYCPQAGKFTWLSRARLSALGNRSARLLDERLDAAGWDVIHPETITIAAQLAQLAASERVACEQGSALHMLMFLKNTRGLKVDIIERDQDLPPKSSNKNYRTIAEAKQLDQTIHRCDFERFIKRRGAAVDKIGENSFKYLEQLGVPRMSLADTAVAGGPAKPKRRLPSMTVGRLNALAATNDTRSYLEIGVADGRTFLHVDFELRHAVDPKFRFDTRNHEAANCRFFETGSDEFFQLFADAELKYDLIFLDGLHTFEQTFRDFCSTQAHCHDGTIWLIDDVVPSDPFSAIPSESLSRRFRKQQHGSGKGPWHGDVFKTILAIHDFFPNLSYRTVVGESNPQSVVIRRPRKDFEPKFSGLEEISRMDYFDFLEQKELLNPVSDEEMLAWLAE